MFGRGNTTDLKFHLFDDKRFVLEETNNQMKVLQFGRWASATEPPEDASQCKWECRTVFTKSDGSEQLGKGCAFSEDGINELARVLVAEGKGNTKDLLNGMKTRTDFLPTLKVVLGQESEIDLSEVDDEFFNPEDIFDDEIEKE